jgi:hypothetical protein
VKRFIVAIGAALVMSLTLSGCFMYFPGMPEGDYWADTPHHWGENQSAYVNIHDGGRLDDDCVLGVIATTATVATAIAVSVAIPPSVIFIVVGWSLAGYTGAVTLNHCLDTFHEQIEGKIVPREIAQQCYVDGLDSYSCAVNYLVYEYHHTTWVFNQLRGRFF